MKFVKLQVTISLYSFTIGADVFHVSEISVPFSVSSAYSYVSVYSTSSIISATPIKERFTSSLSLEFGKVTISASSVSCVVTPSGLPLIRMFSFPKSNSQLQELCSCSSMSANLNVSVVLVASATTSAV